MVGFDDRFTYNNPTFAALDVNTATPDQMLAASTELSDMVASVQRQSVLLKRASVKDIYDTIVFEIDPLLSLQIGAAKNKDGSFRYANVAIIKEFMFGGPDYQEASRNIFNQGLRFVSCLFTAASLVLKLHPAGTDISNFAEERKKEAYANLKKILDSDTNLGTGSSDAFNDANDEHARFYFEEVTFFPIAEFTVEIYIPGYTIGWVESDTIQLGEQTTTADVVAGIADLINAITIEASDANVVAAPMLGWPANQHSIEFSMRQAVVGQIADVISIRFKSKQSNFVTPFKWGVDRNILRDETLNSLLLYAPKDKYITPRAASADERPGYSTLYFRVDPTYINQESPDLSKVDFSMRLNEPDPVIISADLPAEFQSNLNTRPSDTVRLIVDGLSEYKNSARLLGLFVRNDAFDSRAATTAVEIVSWRVNNPEVAFVVDVLSLPSGVVMALGDKLGPKTQFSNRPRSLTVSSIYSRYVPPSQSAGTPLTIQSVKYPKPSFWQKIKDESRELNTNYYRGG